MKLLQNYLNMISQEENREKTQEWIRDLKATKPRRGKGKSFSESSIVSYVKVAKDIDNHFKKPYSDIEKAELKDWFIGLADRYAESTLQTYKTITKILFKWLCGTETYPEIVDWIDFSRVDKQRSFKDMLTSTDIEKMVDSSYRVQDQAIISALFDSGMRAGELLSLNIGDVEINEHYAKVTVRPEVVGNKLGRIREVPLVRCIPYLKNHLLSHPLRTDNNAPVWFSGHGNQFRKHGEIGRLSYSGLTSIIKRASQRVGIKKAVNPHLLRHSRATEAMSVKNWNEQKARRFFGWSTTSTMPSHYAHLGSKAIETQILKDSGLKAEKVEEGMEVRICPRCGAVCGATFIFCPKCAHSFDREKEPPKEAFEKALQYARVQREEVDTRIGELETKMRNFGFEFKEKVIEEVRALEQRMDRRIEERSLQNMIEVMSALKERGLLSGD